VAALGELRVEVVDHRPERADQQQGELVAGAGHAHMVA
jgi:hypothetical protein